MGNNIISELVWRGKGNYSQKARKSNVEDVSVRYGVLGGNKYIRFIFRNGASRMFTSTDYFQFAINENSGCIFFAEGDHDNGIKLTCPDNVRADNKYASIYKKDDISVLKSFVKDGDYRLNQLPGINMWYIEKT